MTEPTARPGRRGPQARALAALACAAAVILPSCRTTAPSPPHRTFTSPEAAVAALIDAVNARNSDDVLAIFGPDSKEIVESSDPATARRRREVFTVAVKERWRLQDQGSDSKVLVVGNEDWPFPIPITRGANGWWFDTAAGKEEVLARRIGHNELAVIRICRAYAAAQRLYAARGHDGRPPGVFARTLRSDPGRQNGLYWPTSHGEKRSPLGDLLAHAAAEGTAPGQDSLEPSPFHGYFFRILTSQGADAAGGAKDYVNDGLMSGGFALVAWPAHYDVTGVTTFIVSHDTIVRERDLGAETEPTASAMRVFNPDASWIPVP